jgi:putative ABC transport system permease protein
MLGLLIKVWRDLAKRPLRSALSILGVAVGVAGLVAILSTSRNITRGQRELFANTSQADMTYWVGNAPASLVPSLQADPRIAKAELRLTYLTRWRNETSWMDIELVGIDTFEQVHLNQFELVEGGFPNVGEILLDVSTAQQSGIVPGSKIAYQDRYGRERYLRVSGISRSPSYLSSRITQVAVGYVPASFLRRMLGIPGSNQLLIKLHDPRDATRVARHIAHFSQRQGLQVGSPEIRSPDQFPGKQELDALIVIMFLFSVMGLILSSFLIINTLSASVAEQINEIGILKALGATRHHILTIYLLEALAYGIVGTMLGLVAGNILGWRLLVWIGSLGNATPSFHLVQEGLALGAVVGIGVSLVGGAIPALQGAQIPIAKALNSYGIRSDYGKARLDRWLQKLGRMPPLAIMAMRNLGRRKARSATTVLVIALSTAAFLGATSTRESLNTAIKGVYATYYADGWMWLRGSVSTQFEDLLPSVDGIYAAEGWAIANGIVKLADARLWGIPPESTLYQPVIPSGRWYRADEPDAVVLSTELADDQNIQVGDKVEIQVGGRTRPFLVVGIAIDNTIFLGSTLTGKAFLPRATLNRMLHQQGQASLFALGLASREPDIADQILAAAERKFQRFNPHTQPVYTEIESAQEASKLLTLGLAAMLIIVTLVGSLGILNTLTLSVLERRREIAVMRAIGATNSALLLTFWVEGLVLGGLGWLIGLALGYPIGYLLTRQLGQVLYSLNFVMSPLTVLASLFFCLCLATVSSLGPALGAAQVSASAALRYE